MGGVLCGQSEGAEAVGHDVRHHRQVFPRGRRQLKDSVHALEHIGGAPSGHGHVAHGVPRLLGGELGDGPQLLGLRCQRRHLLGVSLGQRLHGTHGFLEVRGDIHALHIGFCDLP